MPLEWYTLADGRQLLRVGDRCWSLRDISGRHVMYLTEELVDYERPSRAVSP